MSRSLFSSSLNIYRVHIDRFVQMRCSILIKAWVFML